MDITFKESKKWEIIRAVIGIATYIIVFYGFSELVIDIMSKTISKDFIIKHGVWLDIAIQFIIYIPIFTVLLILFLKDLKADFKIARNQTDTFARKVLIGIGIMYGVNIIANILSMAFKAGESANQEGLVDMITYNAVTPFILIFLVGIIGPIVEEIVYRKCLSSIIRNKYAFIVVSMFIFGFIHVISTEGSFSTKLITAIPYIAQGFAFSFIYIKNDKNLTFPIICHMCNNILATILIIFMK